MPLQLQDSAACSPAAATVSHGSRLPEILFSTTAVVLVAIRIVLSRMAFSHAPGSDWIDSDWMINYAAGFVRRGLGGAVLIRVVRATGWEFFPVVTAATVVPGLIAAGWMLRFVWRLRGSALWRFAILFNPVLLIAVADCGGLTRKDSVFLCATLLTVTAAGSLLRRISRGTDSRAGACSLFIFAGVAALVLALLHEGIFLFEWLPLNLMLLAAVLARLRFRRTTAILTAGLCFVPSLLATAAAVHWHGSPETAQTICRSWRFAAPFPCTSGPAFPPALGALGWTVSRGVEKALSHAFMLPVWLAAFCLAAGILLLALRELLPDARLEELTVVLAFPALCCLPLFVLGLDWGRWLCTAAVSSLITISSPELCLELYRFLPPMLRRSLETAIVPRLGHFLDVLSLLIRREPILFCCALFLLPLPPLPIPSAVLLNNPVGNVFNLVYHLIASR